MCLTSAVKKRFLVSVECTSITDMLEGRGGTIIGRKNQQSAHHESLHISSSLSLNLSLKTIHQNNKQRTHLSWCTTWTGCLSNIFQAPAILQQTGPHKK